MPFSRFMELALYHPEFGYYTGGSHKIGGSGDFITAPTLSPYLPRHLLANSTHFYRKLPATFTNLVQVQAGWLLNC
ncbi:hypothetical protein [Neisseria weixii]|uniref:hypothetical protein n=1 Tax=Neisseria weixii TaxID=1853276 RepID=UPI0039F4E14A